MLSLTNESVKCHISKGNVKVGAIPNFSLTPGVSCSRQACATCHVNGCYAMKSYRMYKNVRNAWDENTSLALFNIEELEKQIRAYLSKYKGKFFRIHVAGDFITKEYAQMWFRIIKDYPGIIFLAFTKQFDNVRDIPFDTLTNMTLLLSDWEGIEMPEDLKERYQIAYCIEHDDVIPENTVLCPGSCENCNACWFLRDVHKNVAFYKH